MDTIGFIGCVLMVGVVVKNGIVLLDFAEKRRHEGMPIEEAVQEAAAAS